MTRDHVYTALIALVSLCIGYTGSQVLCSVLPLTWRP